MHFINDGIKHFTKHFLLKHANSRTYYPRGNEPVEFFNKMIKTLLMNILNENHRFGQTLINSDVFVQD